MGVKGQGRIYFGTRPRPSNPMPSISVPGPSQHPSQPIHTHLRLSIPTKAFNTYLMKEKFRLMTFPVSNLATTVDYTDSQ